MMTCLSFRVLQLEVQAPPATHSMLSDSIGEKGEIALNKYKLGGEQGDLTVIKRHVQVNYGPPALRREDGGPILIIEPYHTPSL
jgi:hypothetical protein